MTTSVFTSLDTLSQEIIKIDFVNSVGIGIEPNLAPQDYPMVRIVPQRFTPGKYNNRICECGFFFGMATNDADGRENVYKRLFELERELIRIIKEQGGRYFETVTDEAALDTYKLMYIRADLDIAREDGVDG